MIIWSILIFFAGLIQSRPQACDPIFEKCEPDPPKCADPIFGCDETPTEKTNIVPTDCFDSTNEIESAIFEGDTRQAFNDCDPTSGCSKYAEEGYACAPSWTCHNNTIITDGKGLIDVRTSDDDFCAETLGTLDASDSKCEDFNHVCCKQT